MTLKERIKETADYFGLTLSKFDEDKLINIWHMDPIEKKVFKIIYKERSIPRTTYIPAKIVSLQQHFNLICELYDVDPVKCLQPNRGLNYIKAKAHFCREIKLTKPKTSATFLAHFLRYKDHSPINNLLYYSTIEIPIPPLKLPQRTITYQTNCKRKHEIEKSHS